MPERYEATVAADNVFPGDSAKWHTYISSVTSEMSVDGIDSVCRNCRNALNELAYVFQVPDARLELEGEKKACFGKPDVVWSRR